MFRRKQQPIVVRTYHGMNARKAFEKDAQVMARKGYRVAHEVWQRHTLLGVHLGTGTLMVTYELNSTSVPA